MTTIPVTLNDREILFSAAVALMDDDIREALHSEMSPCEPQEFIDAYAAAHAKKFGETFQVN